MLSNRSPKIDKKGLVRLPFPAEIAIETHSFCNLQCIVCPHVRMKRKKGKMATELFHKIVDEVAAVSPDTRLWLAIMGEPCLDKDIVAHCKYVQSKGLKRVHLNSNGTFLEGDVARGVLEAGVQSIYVAIDACTEETYLSVRPGGDFHRTVRNVENLLKLRDEIPGCRTEIVVQFIVMDENAHETDAFHGYWIERGAVVKLRLRQGWGQMVTTPDLTNEDVERFPCPWLLRTMNIHWTGHVTQCDVDFEEDHPAGDINAQSIAEVWHDDLAHRREKHWEGDFSHPLCKDCKDWSAGRAEFFYPDSAEGHEVSRWSLGEQAEEAVPHE